MRIPRKKILAQQKIQKKIPSSLPSTQKKNSPSSNKKTTVQKSSLEQQTASRSTKTTLATSKKSKNIMTKTHSTEETPVLKSSKPKKTQTSAPKNEAPVSKKSSKKKPKKTKKKVPILPETPAVVEVAHTEIAVSVAEVPKKIQKKKHKKKVASPKTQEDKPVSTSPSEKIETPEVEPQKDLKESKSAKKKIKSKKNPRISKTAEAAKDLDTKEIPASPDKVSESSLKENAKKRSKTLKKAFAEKIATAKITQKAKTKKDAETKKSKKTSFTAFANTYYDSSEPLYRRPKRTINEFTNFPSDELFKAYQRKLRIQIKEQKNQIEPEEEFFDPQYPHLRKNEAIPNFLLSDLSYGIHNLKELQSKKVILFHWSSWDKRCRETLLNWYRFWIQRKNEFALVTIAQDQSPMMVQAFRDYHQLYGQECYFLIDRDASIQDYFPLYDLPRVHLVNEFGIISGSVHDPIQPTDHLESFLRTRPLEDLPKLAANIPTIRDMKRKMEEAQEETIENKFDLAHGYFLNGKGRVSAAILEEIIELQPENGKAHFRRGVILWELGMIERAMEHLTKARDLDKNNELYKKRIQVLEKPELFYSREQLNYKPPSSNTGAE